ncbi:transposase (plasmid) [Shinella sp. WSC3-e]|nr:hypothetical protein SHINE37_60024 [Rhizobiaceae bacterium]CAK7262098.1 transposase [Shinella sp. WSC3-e]
MACERRTKLRKLARFLHVRQSVIERILHGWSLQQIAGRMRLERHPISVSHETIYKFAYSADGHAIKLWKHLPEHRARRRPRHARRRHGQRFSPDLNIQRRPDVVADRKQFGHWECDLIQFRQKFGKANVTSLVERVSRFAVLLRNNDRQSRPIMERLIGALQTLPHRARRSITFDRGTEFRDLVLRPTIALAKRHRREHQRSGQEMAFEGCRSTLDHRPGPEGNLRPPEHDAAQVPRLQDAGRGLPSEAARTDAIRRIGSSSLQVAPRLELTYKIGRACKMRDRL